MANYAVEVWASDIGSISVVLAAFETKLETIDSGKTIRFGDVVHRAGNTYQAYLVYDT